ERFETVLVALASPRDRRQMVIGQLTCGLCPGRKARRCDTGATCGMLTIGVEQRFLLDGALVELEFLVGVPDLVGTGDGVRLVDQLQRRLIHLIPKRGGGLLWGWRCCPCGPIPERHGWSPPLEV